MNHALQAAVFATVAAPILLQFLKAFWPGLAARKLPFVAGFLGAVLTVGAAWLLGADFNRSMLLAAIVGAFGPGGFYELVSKTVDPPITP